MKLGVIVGALIGLALATGLILHFGWRQIGEAALAAGWQGLAALIGIYFVCLIISAFAWQAVILDAPHNIFLACLWSRWLRESVGNLLALLPTAGEIAGARELTLQGVPPGMAGASTVVDLTTELVSQIVFTLFGLALSSSCTRARAWALRCSFGMAISAAVVAGFILAQRNGLFDLLERLPETSRSQMGVEGAAGERKRPGRHPGALSSSSARLDRCGLHLAGWIVGAGEAWVGLWFMGQLAWSDALISRARLRLAHRILRGSSRLGIQEGGYIVIGAMFGLSPEVALGPFAC